MTSRRLTRSYTYFVVPTDERPLWVDALTKALGGPPDCSGLLHKLTQNRRSWKPVNATLRGQVLHYFVNAETAEHVVKRGSRSRSKIVLHAANWMKPTGAPSPPFAPAFYLIVQTDRRLNYFCVSKERRSDGWKRPT